MTSLFFDIFGRDQGATQAFNDVGRAADNAGTRLAALNTQMQAAARAEQEATTAMEAAAHREAAARTEAEQAANRLRTAEQQLDQVRRAIAPTAGNIAAAEQRVSQARRDAEAAARELSNAEQATVSAAERLAQAHNNASNAARQHSTALREAQNSVRSFGTELDNLVTKFNSLDLGRTKFALIGASIQPLLASIGQLSGALGLLPAAAVAVGTAFGTAVVGVQGMGTALKAAETASKASAAAAQADAQVQQGVAGAVQTAAAAHKTAAQAADAYAASLKGLAPSAQQVVSAIVQLKPAFDGLRLDVQQHLFQGIAQELQNLGSSVLPVVRTGMTQMADALNNAIKQVAQFAQQKSSIEDYKQIFASVAQAAQSMAGAIKPILQIFTDVAAVGAPLLAQLADHFKTAAQHAAEFVSQARQTGQLKQWIQDGIAAVRELWGVLKDVVAIIKDLATAQGFGPNFLEALHAVTTAIRWIIENVPGATTIIQAFFDAWLFAKIIQGLTNMVTTIGTVISALKKLVTANEEAAVASEAAATRTKSAWLTAALGIGAAFAAGEGLKAVGKDTPATSGAVPDQSRLDKLQQGAGTAGKLFTGDLKGFFDDVVKQIEALPKEMQKTGDQIRHIMDTAWDGIKTGASTAVTAVVNFFKGLPSKISGAVGGLKDTLAQKAQDLWDGFTARLNTAWNTVVNWFKSIPQKILAAIGDAKNWIAQKAQDLWDGFRTRLESAWNTVVTFFRGIPGKISTAVGNIRDALVQKAQELWDGFKARLDSAWNTVAQFFRDLPNKIKQAVGSLRDALVEKAQELWDGFKQRLDSAWNTVDQWFRDLPNKIKQAVGDLSQALAQAGQSVMQGFYQKMIDFYNNTIRPWLQSIAQSIASLKGPADKDYYILHDAGTQIMAGFHDAMQSRWGHIRVWLRGLRGEISIGFGGGDWWEDLWRRLRGGGRGGGGSIPQVASTIGTSQLQRLRTDLAFGGSGIASYMRTVSAPITQIVPAPSVTQPPGRGGHHGGYREHERMQTVYLDSNSAFMQEILRYIRAEVRKQGGDVQVVLGR